MSPAPARILRDDETRLLGNHRCGQCCHLIGLHVEDPEYGVDVCAVADCGCSLRPLGPEQPRPPRAFGVPQYVSFYASRGA